MDISYTTKGADGFVRNEKNTFFLGNMPDRIVVSRYMVGYIQCKNKQALFQNICYWRCIAVVWGI